MYRVNTAVIIYTTRTGIDAANLWGLERNGFVLRHKA